LKESSGQFHPERIRLLHGFKANETSKDDIPLVQPVVLRPTQKELRGLVQILKKRDDLPVRMILGFDGSASFLH